MATVLMPEQAILDVLKTHKITLSKQLGSGAFSEVFKGVAVLKGEKVSVAVKLYTTKFTDLTHRQIFDLARREVEVAAKFDHPNVMRTFSLMASGGVIASCLELAFGGDLCSRVIKDTGMGAKEGAEALAGIARGLRYLHESQMLVHCDIKAENVLMDGNVAKLADFDATVSIGTPLENPRGTLDFLPPELVRSNEIYFMQPSNDLWGLGIVAYLLLFGTYPWDRADPCDNRFAKYASFRACYDSGSDFGDCAWAGIPDGLNVLFAQLLALEEANRGTAADAAAFFENEWREFVTELRRPRSKRGSTSSLPMLSTNTKRGSSDREAKHRTRSPAFGRIANLFRARSPRTSHSQLLRSDSPDSPSNFLSPPRPGERSTNLSPLSAHPHDIHTALL